MKLGPGLFQRILSGSQYKQLFNVFENKCKTFHGGRIIAYVYRTWFQWVILWEVSTFFIDKVNTEKQAFVVIAWGNRNQISYFKNIIECHGKAVKCMIDIMENIWMYLMTLYCY